MLRRYVNKFKKSYKKHPRLYQAGAYLALAAITRGKSLQATPGARLGYNIYRGVRQARNPPVHTYIPSNSHVREEVLARIRGYNLTRLRKVNKYRHKRSSWIK